MKLLTVLGARPQFIKAAPVSRAIAAAGGIEHILVHTGQHYDHNMSDVFFQDLGLPAPRHNLGIGAGSHGAMTGRQLEAIESVLIDEKPDAVMVFGDTNSTLAGALAAAKLHIPVAHVEAGLRSFNRRMPEEINRVLTDHVSTWLFAPSEQAMEHLGSEGISHDKVVNTGDVMYDAAMIFGAQAKEHSTICADLGLPEKGFRLSTVHRQENTDDPARLRIILEVLADLALNDPVVLPLHPRTRNRCEACPELSALLRGIKVIEPVGFFDIIRLLQAAKTVITDSGGMQKEAFFHGTPVVVLRDETEWSELVDLGWARLEPPLDARDVLKGIALFESAERQTGANPYGDGNAAGKIVETLGGSF